MGRAGTEAYPDTVIAVLSSLTVLVLTSTTASLISLQIRRRMIRILAFITCVGFLYAAFFAKSYSETRPKRLYAQHITRNFREDNTYDSGLWINGIDWTTLYPLRFLRRRTTKDHEERTQIMTCTESSLLYCDLPW